VAVELGILRVFCLTFEVAFFSRHGFKRLEGTPVDSDVYAQLLRSDDEGVAEFLDLDRVKPNTLGNVRMLRRMTSAGSEKFTEQRAKELKFSLPQRNNSDVKSYQQRY
jgi:amino-acid N-acetyltransferase